MSLLLALAASAALRLPPVDQCHGDGSFDRFRGELASAVERRDMDALLGLMADDVRVSFGGRYGKEQFREYWRTAPSGSQSIWAELGDAMTLGCAPRGKARVFPSMFVQADDLDGFTTWVARPGARLRTRPSFSGRVRARLSWHVLTEDGNDTGGPWLSVKTASGLNGFVHRSAARSIIDYRLLAEPRGDVWRITAFVAGD